MILRKRLPAMFIRTSTSTISRRIFTPLPSRLTTSCQIPGMQSSPTTMANPSIGTPMANTGSIIIILMTTQTLGRSQLGNGIFLRRISNRRSTYKAITLVTFYQLTLSPSTSRNFLLKSKPGPLWSSHNHWLQDTTATNVIINQNPNLSLILTSKKCTGRTQVCFHCRTLHLLFHPSHPNSLFILLWMFSPLLQQLLNAQFVQALSTKKSF